ncbi:MAG TPA: maltose ABC transporter permease MalG [Anaeromyxobacter sp.]|nr:maltose ABC transporter permease MalG [Anaeromyxobacter sp.]
MAIVQGKGHKWRLLGAHLGLVAICLLVLFPLLMVVSISLRPGNFATGDIVPRKISLEHWSLALGIPYVEADGTVVPPPFPVLHWLWNSVKIAGLAAFFSVVMSTTAAFAFARMKFVGKNALLNSMLLMQMFPPVLALVGIFALFDTLGNYVPALGVESHAAVILAYLGGLALHIWTIRSYFYTIPVEIEECAVIDGATQYQSFLYILLPMAVPILMVVFVLAFIGAMIEYPIASILLRQVDHLTLAVGSRYYLYEQKYLWGDFAAAAVLSGIPITVVFLLAQRWIVSGLTAGGVKG